MPNKKTKTFGIRLAAIGLVAALGIGVLGGCAGGTEVSETEGEGSQTSTFSEPSSSSAPSSSTAGSQTESSGNGVVSQPGDSKERMSILMVGDSNFEYGYISTHVRDKIVEEYGDYGGGYLPINPTSWGKNAARDTKVLVDPGVESHDSALSPGNGDPGPHLAPAGTYLTMVEEGQRIFIQFQGRAIDLYYTVRPDGGTFSVCQGKEVVETLDTKGPLEVKRVRIESAKPNAVYTTYLKSQGSSPVTICGFDVRVNNPDDNKRSLVHLWGNAGATTVNYRDVPAEIDISALKLLNPTHVVFLLGTNDCTTTVPKEKVQENLHVILTRFKEALPDATIMLLSPPATLSSEWNKRLESYDHKSIAAKAGVDFWDMYGFVGPFWQKNYLPGDGIHINDTCGNQIALEMIKQLRSK